MKTEPQILKGMRDFLAPRMRLRRYAISTLTAIFERYGFEPLETPAIEYAETFEGKIGEEGDKLMYKFEDRGGRRVGLRYDLTVPMARAVSMYPDLVKPYKRYQIAPVWRAEKPQKGRYREFWQCDVDVVGTRSVMADAEVLRIVDDGLRALGFTRFVIKINHRQVLGGLLKLAGVPEQLATGVHRAIDKLQKIGLDAVRGELAAIGVPEESAAKLLEISARRASNREMLGDLKQKLAGIPAAEEGATELAQLVEYLIAMGVPEEDFQVDFSMVRGLDYYTGAIFETVVEEPKIGSISGGGRYDRLIGTLGGRDYPATGVAFGLERIIDVIEELQMAPTEVGESPTKALVTVFSSDLAGHSLRMAKELRDQGINTEVYLGTEKLGLQFRYADRKGVPYVIVIGPDELQSGVVVLRDMRAKEERQLPARDVAGLLAS